MELHMVQKHTNNPGNFADTLTHITNFINHKGYPPTVRELCEITGIRSTSAMAYQLQKLQERGCIKLVPKISRGIILTDKELTN